MLVIFVIVRNSSSGGDSSRRLTVCESAWQEAIRSLAQSGPDADTRIVLQPTLTACDTVAEWDAATGNSNMEEGPVVIDKLCGDLGVTNTRVCMEAKQKAGTPLTPSSTQPTTQPSAQPLGQQDPQAEDQHH